MYQVIPWAIRDGIVTPAVPDCETGVVVPAACEDMLYDSEAMRRFARIDPLQDTVPDETSIGKFRHLLERHALTAHLFDAINTLLAERTLFLKAVTTVDATIIGPRSSTKNATHLRDPEMRQTRKGNQ
jgi:IS5 family transposase